jgi:hypothetical protein
MKKRVILYLMLLFLISSTINIYAVGNVDLTINLTNYYSFDDGSANSITGKDDGTITSSVYNYTNGKQGNAFNFSGGYIDLNFENPIDTPFTISAWVRSNYNNNSNTIIAANGGWVGIMSGTSSSGGGFGTAGKYNAWAHTDGYRWANSSSDITNSTFTNVVARFNDSMLYIYINGQFEYNRSTTITHDIGGRGNWILGSILGSQTFGGVIDEVGIWNTTLNETAISQLYSRISPYNETILADFETPTPADGSRDTTLKTIQINCQGNATTARYYLYIDKNLTPTTPVLLNSSLNSWIMANLSSGRYYYRARCFDDTTKKYSSYTNVRLYEYAPDIIYAGYKTYLAVNYTKTINYTTNVSCASGSNTYLDRYINGLFSSRYKLTCDNKYRLYNLTYLNNYTGNYSIKFYINVSGNPAPTYQWLNNVSLFSDIEAPKVLVLNFSVTNGFNNIPANVTLNCSDRTIIPITYNLTINKVNFFYANLTNASQIINNTFEYYGYNNITAVCSDLFSSTSLTISPFIYMQTVYLINERTGKPFDVNNISRVILYWDDNSTSFNFKTQNTNSTNITFSEATKLRLELGYSSGTVITRYIDTSLTKGNIRLCANTEGVTHYQHLILSASEKPALMYNVFANCYIAADYTRFAYQSNYVLQAQAIDASYALDTYDSDDNQINLAGIDGSIAAYEDLDNLEFQQTRLSMNIRPDTLNFKNDANNNQVIIYYRNDRDDNTLLNLSISRLDTQEEIYTKSDFADLNEFTIYFNYATLFNITNTTVFRATVTKSNPAGISTIKRYFDRTAKSGIIASGVAFTIAVMLTIFGLTLTLARITLSWFGFFILIGSIAILSFAIPAWYITIFMAMDVILIIYVLYTMISYNYPTLT